VEKAQRKQGGGGEDIHSTKKQGKEERSRPSEIGRREQTQGTETDREKHNGWRMGTLVNLEGKVGPEDFGKERFPRRGKRVVSGVAGVQKRVGKKTEGSKKTG